jgi:DNA-binding phage protein
MAITTIRTTYALDVETVRRLEALARDWGVSKSEALRRAIRAAEAPRTDRRLEAMKALRASLNLSPQQASRWASQVRDERRRASAKRAPVR